MGERELELTIIRLVHVIPMKLKVNGRNVTIDPSSIQKSTAQHSALFLRGEQDPKVNSTMRSRAE